MKTRLTELLDIEHPVMLAGMGGVSYSALVAAVSEAGGIGTFGAAAMRPGQLDEEIGADLSATSPRDLLEKLVSDTHSRNARWAPRLRRVA